MIRVIQADTEDCYDLKVTPRKQTCMLGIVREMGGPQYRCTSGHSMNCIDSEAMGWERLTCESCPAYLIHGTNETGLSGIISSKFLRSAKSQAFYARVSGATAQKERLHQHLVGCTDLTGPVARKCRKRDLLIYLDAHKVLRSGAQIYRTRTGIILIECDIPTYCIAAVRQSSNWGWRLWPGEHLSNLLPTAPPPSKGIPSFTDVIRGRRGHPRRVVPERRCRAAESRWMRCRTQSKSKTIPFRIGEEPPTQ